MHDFNDYELNSPEAFFHEGMDLLESDHLEEALHSFERVVSVQPYNADAFFQKGITLIKLGRASDAIKSFESAISLSPTEPLFHSHCGYALLMAGSHDEALDRFQYALHLQPDNYEHKVYMACVLAEKSRLGEAFDILSGLVHEHPDNVDILRHYSSVLYLLGEDHLALQNYQKILTIDPNHTESIHHKGVIYLRQGNRPAAIRCFREFLALMPQDAAAWNLLLDTLTEQDQPAAVIAAASEAIQSGIETAFIYLYRGRALLNERQYNEAILDLRRSRTLDDRQPETHLLLAQAFIERGRIKHALLSINRALQIVPGDRRSLFIKARICRELKDHDGELEALDSLLKLDRNDFRIIQLKVDNLAQRLELETASKCIEDFLEDNPRHRRGLLIKAELAEKLNKTSDAEECYATLLKLNSVSAKTYRAYAGFLLRHGQRLEACQVLHQATMEHPQNHDVFTLQAIVLQMLDQHSECIESLQKFTAAHSHPPEMNWLLGKSFYALQNYQCALESFQAARLAGATSSAVSPDAPEFKCLLAEAYSLHHLGKTVDGIALLEEQGRRFENYSREFHEILAELYNHICAYSKACAIAAEGLVLFPDSPVLHYRLARCSAALGRKSTALRHLGLAIELDRSLIATACQDNRFQKYALSPHLNQLVGYYFYKRRIEFLGLVIAVLVVAMIIAWSLR